MKDKTWWGSGAGKTPFYRCHVNVTARQLRPSFADSNPAIRHQQDINFRNLISSDVCYHDIDRGLFYQLV